MADRPMRQNLRISCLFTWISALYNVGALDSFLLLAAYSGLRGEKVSRGCFCFVPHSTCIQYSSVFPYCVYAVFTMYKCIYFLLRITRGHMRPPYMFQTARNRHASWGTWLDLAWGPNCYQPRSHRDHPQAISCQFHDSFFFVSSFFGGFASRPCR